MTPTNQFPRDYDGIKRQNADAAADTLNNWIRRAEKFEAAAAEMRAILEHVLKCCCDDADWSDISGDAVHHALSLDVGKDFVPRAELEKAQAACAEMGNVHAMNTHSIIELTKERDRLEARNKRLETALNWAHDHGACNCGEIGEHADDCLVAQALVENKDTP